MVQRQKKRARRAPDKLAAVESMLREQGAIGKRTAPCSLSILSTAPTSSSNPSSIPSSSSSSCGTGALQAETTVRIEARNQSLEEAWNPTSPTASAISSSSPRPNAAGAGAAGAGSLSRSTSSSGSESEAAAIMINPAAGAAAGASTGAGDGAWEGAAAGGDAPCGHARWQ